MALFLAIDPPRAFKKNLQEQLIILKREYPYFSWVAEENLRLTLGTFSDSVKPTNSLLSYLEEVTFDIPQFELFSGEADISLQNKIILSLLFRRQKNLERLVARIKEKNLLTQNKKFVPYITFARYRIPSKQQYLLIKKKIQALRITIDFTVKSIDLFNNQIIDGKQTSKKMATFPLEAFH